MFNKLQENIAKKLSQLNESAKSIPLEGHPYHKKSDDELKYIIKDAGDAAKAMKSIGNTEKESKYLDQVNDASTVLYHRKGLKESSNEEYNTHYESFQAALEAAKKSALERGYIYDSNEYDTFLNSGYIKSKESKSHAFHMNLSDKHGNNLNKIHSFQITGKGDGKFYLNQDIK